ncbi:MAG: DsbA family protein [Geminicoccaceae bacterium]
MLRWQHRAARCALAAALVLLLAPSGARAADAPASELSRDQVEAIVRDYLMREPEVIYQALQELQHRQAAESAERQRKAVAANRTKLLNDPASPVGGNPDGDVTLVEFFDYRCPYCRHVVASLRELLGDDPELRIVFKDLPVLGADSVRAAKAALASRLQDRYVPFHFALMASEDLSLDGIRATARSVGLDPDRLVADMNAPEVQRAIDDNYRLAQELGIEGTPAFVIGGQLIPGAVEKTHLAELIQEARTNCLNC